MAKKKKKRTVAMPGLADVETFSTLPEGEYHVRVTDVEQKESQSSDFDYLNWELQVASGEHENSKLWYITSFNPKSLWNLKLWLEALEAEIPEEPEEIAVDDLIGLELMVTVSHEEYDGKTRARVADFAAIEADEEKEDVEVEDEEEGEEESEKYTAEDIQGMDDDELADLVKKHDLDVKLKKYKTAKKKQNAVIAALEEEGLIEEEDDEE